MAELYKVEYMFNDKYKIKLTYNKNIISAHNCITHMFKGCHIMSIILIEGYTYKDKSGATQNTGRNSFKPGPKERPYPKLGVGEFPLDMVLSEYIMKGEGRHPGPDIVGTDGVTYNPKYNSQRYILFKTKGCKCVSCGIEGNIAILTRNKFKLKNPTAHFNIYHKTEDGMYVLMTKDHIIPKALNGPNNLNNYQTMCSHCNETKGATLEYIDDTVDECQEI